MTVCALCRKPERFTAIGGLPLRCLLTFQRFDQTGSFYLRVSPRRCTYKRGLPLRCPRITGLSPTCGRLYFSFYGANGQKSSDHGFAKPKSWSSAPGVYLERHAAPRRTNGFDQGSAGLNGSTYRTTTHFGSRVSAGMIHMHGNRDAGKFQTQSGV